MKRLNAAYLPLSLILAITGNAQTNAPLKLLHTTPLPGFTGDLDHSAADLGGHRLFVTAEVHKTVEVFDLNTGEHLHSITGFGTPHEILFRPDSNTLIVADGGADSSVRLVDGKTYQIIGSIKLPPGVDSAEYNPVTKEYYVENRGPDPSANTHGQKPWPGFTKATVAAIHRRPTAG
jgi:WD40 repeat protein